MGAMISCSAVYRNHGFTPLGADLAKIVIGAFLSRLTEQYSPDGPIHAK
jgi:hypothetical protein